MPPNVVPGVHRVEQALRAAPMGSDIILMGGLNTRLGDPRDECEVDLTTALADRGLVIMIDHFLPRI